MPDSSNIADCHALARQYDLLPRLPASVRELFTRHAIEETPKSDDPAFIRTRWWMILSNGALLEAAKKEAEHHGWFVHIDNTCDDWDYAKAADHLLAKLRELRRQHQRVCLLSGGEVTVHVENGGTGGRNQQFALYCAAKIAEEEICVLSAGSDGIDGNSRAAGAVADGTTVERAKARGLDVHAHLKGFDACPLFETLGDAILTGPTGNNLRDLRILLAY